MLHVKISVYHRHLGIQQHTIEKSLSRKDTYMLVQVVVVICIIHSKYNCNKYRQAITKGRVGILQKQNTEGAKALFKKNQTNTHNPRKNNPKPGPTTGTFKISSSMVSMIGNARNVKL